MLHLRLNPIGRYGLSLAILLSFKGCSETPSEQKASRRDTPSVQVVNYPLQYFAERIGGELIEVGFLVPPDVDPAYWRPDAEAVVAFQRADLIFLNGAGYAQWIDRVSLPVSRLIDTSAGFREDYIEIRDTSTHQHGPQGEHTHGEIAFTTWLDPTLGIEQARAIMTALSRKWPDHAETFESNFESLELDLSTLDADLKRLFSSRADEPLLASHPVYQYLARRYGLEVISLHWEPQQPQMVEMMTDLDSLLVEHPATFMLWEGEPLDVMRRQLKDRGVKCIVFEPAANAPDEGDFMNLMRKNVEELARLF